MSWLRCWSELKDDEEVFSTTAWFSHRDTTEMPDPTALVKRKWFTCHTFGTWRRVWDDIKPLVVFVAFIGVQPSVSPMRGRTSQNCSAGTTMTALGQSRSITFTEATDTRLRPCFRE